MAVLSVFGVSSTITVAQVGEAMAKAGALFVASPFVREGEAAPANGTEDVDPHVFAVDSTI